MTGKLRKYIHIGFDCVLAQYSFITLQLNVYLLKKILTHRQPKKG